MGKVKENYYKYQNPNSRDIITWVFCEDCYNHDEAKREIPNCTTEEVDIVKVYSDFDGLIIKFNCQRCKDAKRPWKNKESRVEITANELQAHPFLDPDYEPSESNLSDQFLYENFQEQLDMTKTKSIYGKASNRLNELKPHLPLAKERFDALINSIASHQNCYTLRMEIGLVKDLDKLQKKWRNKAVEENRKPH